MPLQMKIDAPRRHDERPRRRPAERERQRRHRHPVGVVRMDDFGSPLTNESRQPPRRGQVGFAACGERHQVGTLPRAPEELAFRVRHEDGPVTALPQSQHGQEDLVLSAAPGACGVEMEGEHSSHSFANLRATYCAFMLDTIRPAVPSRKPPRST